MITYYKATFCGSSLIKQNLYFSFSLYTFGARNE